MTNPDQVAALVAIGALGLSVVLVAALHVLEPEYDASWRMLSEYALGRFGFLMRVAFVAAAIGVIATGMALSTRAWPAVALLWLVSIGPLGASVIDTDPITTPRPEMSRRSNVHAALGTLFILGFPVAATLVGLASAGDPRIRPILAVASIGPWAALAWFLGTSIRHARPDVVGAPDIPIGWPNRASMLAYLGWAALAAALVLR